MRQLSERLESIIEPVWSHEASPSDLTALLCEAAEIVKRYEDAPVVDSDISGYVGCTTRWPGQRVRLVVEGE